MARPRPKMAEAVALAALVGTVDRALGHAAVMGPLRRRRPGLDIAHHVSAGLGEARRAGEVHTLQPRTSAWEGFGR